MWDDMETVTFRYFVHLTQFHERQRKTGGYAATVVRSPDGTAYFVRNAVSQEQQDERFKMK